MISGKRLKQTTVMPHLYLLISGFQVVFVHIISFSPYSSEMGRARGILLISQMKLSIACSTLISESPSPISLLGYHVSPVL